MFCKTIRLRCKISDRFNHVLITSTKSPKFNNPSRTKRFNWELNDEGCYYYCVSYFKSSSCDRVTKQLAIIILSKLRRSIFESIIEMIWKNQRFENNTHAAPFTYKVILCRKTKCLRMPYIVWNPWFNGNKFSN